MIEIQPSVTPSDPLEPILERNERELFAFNALTGSEQTRFQLSMRKHYAENPWAFLSQCVLTLDQVSQDNPIKPFPSYLEYLKFLCMLWQKEKLLAVPKSRRMVCSWNFIALYLHDAIFNSGRFHGFVSKKEDDAGDLIARAEFIYNRIPEWRIPRALLPRLKNGKMSKQPPLIEFEEINSKIQGFPQGADQLRQFTLSGILGDECAFWDQAQAFYSASKPTLDGGGRMTLISSRSPGFFKKIVFDQLDAQDLTFRETPPVPVKQPLEGVELWKNPRNKFVVVDLHYTADPRKRGEAWREGVRQSMPIRDFLMEYERSWQTFEGKPVYADFNRSIHVSKAALKPEPGIPLLLGWDFGLCYDNSTEVLTKAGWKLFKDVNPKEFVAVLNPETFELSYEVPKLKVELPYNGKFYSCESSSINFHVTEDHIIPSWTETNKLERHYAKDLLEKPGHRKLRMTCKWSGENAKNQLDLDPHIFAAFMGAYLSEGSVDKNSNRVTIYQTKDKQWIKDVLINTPWLWHESKDYFRCSDNKLANYLRDFGIQQMRYIPAEIRHGTKDVIAEFIRTYTLGDGHIRTRKNGSIEHTIFTSSPKMSSDLQEIALKMQWTSSERIQKETKSWYEAENRWIKSSPGYVVTFKKSTDWSELRTAEIKSYPYKGTVYCLSVSTGILCIRRNGKTHFNGNTPACLIAQLVGRRLIILHEFLEDNGSINKLAPVIWNHLQLNYLPWLHGEDKIISYIDPAGFQRKDTDESTCAGVLRAQGFKKILPGPVNWEPRRKAVEDYLTKTYGEGPGIIMSDETAPILAEGFAGGYRYPESALTIEPTSIRPIKNKYSHPHDALQYLAAGATALRRQYDFHLPTPDYGFQTRTGKDTPDGTKLPK